jgi:hypothetical protein
MPSNLTNLLTQHTARLAQHTLPYLTEPSLKTGSQVFSLSVEIHINSKQQSINDINEFFKV